MRTIPGVGANGAIVTRLQAQFTAAGYDTKGSDGRYGKAPCTE